MGNLKVENLKQTTSELFPISYPVSLKVILIFSSKKCTNLAEPHTNYRYHNCTWATFSILDKLFISNINNLPVNQMDYLKVKILAQNASVLFPVSYHAPLMDRLTFFIKK